ncbi:transcription antitermination factor NusB [Buchnera aphidicola (Taiwanaphis decaspermi)]|uniref:transcription antitermination factor NusB n=1 Tax=Buchnera aphidicola TaxID=9 RepID=UPI0031B81231
MKLKYRTLARQYAVQALYCWEISKNNINEIEKYFFFDKKNKIDVIYFRNLIIGVSNYHIIIDNVIKNYLSRPISRLNPIEKTILRLSFYELIKIKTIPYKVIINEAIELAKIFGAIDSHKFINAVLDNAAKKINV